MGSGAATAPVAAAIPAGFDVEGFERIAKTVFMRMQEANDRADLDDLRRFTTPEMFATAKMDITERGGVAQNTDVLKLDAVVAEVAQEGTRQIVSVRFQGLVREERESAASDFNELWHLVREGDEPAWRLAGIQPLV
jgi:predicted lipid-binding transport protein (Tim44 family)